MSSADSIPNQPRQHRQAVAAGAVDRSGMIAAANAIAKAHGVPVSIAASSHWKHSGPAWGVLHASSQDLPKIMSEWLAASDPPTRSSPHARSRWGGIHDRNSITRERFKRDVAVLADLPAAMTAVHMDRRHDEQSVADLLRWLTDRHLTGQPRGLALTRWAGGPSWHLLVQGSAPELLPPESPLLAELLPGLEEAHVRVLQEPARILVRAVHLHRNFSHEAAEQPNWPPQLPSGAENPIEL